MILCSMTATFGKLDGETLSFSPGLNLITAPNEWGKSTWCAFLLAMLYGIDTRQRARQGQLPDKERYKPWSGKPMEGSMEVLWQNRRITIQRQTKGRVPMGHFRAFETETGFPVPELTADRCGHRPRATRRSCRPMRGRFRAFMGFLSGNASFISSPRGRPWRLTRNNIKKPPPAALCAVRGGRFFTYVNRVRQRMCNSGSVPVWGCLSARWSRSPRFFL